jgi:hypothetical protein
MRKMVLSLGIISLFVFGGCSVRDLFIDGVAVHNGLIKEMDDVILAEENFYNEYWALSDGVDVGSFVSAYEEFAKEVSELRLYFEETKFASYQEVFVEEYNEYYRDFISDYIKYAGEFADKVEADGYTFESMEPYFGDLDEYTVDFVEKHGKLIGTINVQADSTSSGITY